MKESFGFKSVSHDVTTSPPEWVLFGEVGEKGASNQVGLCLSV